MNEPEVTVNPEVVEEECDILLIGGGMACCGAAFEIMKWAEGTGLNIKLVDKAAMDRSGAVAQGLSAINTYMGENDPADYVRYVRGDLMGITREDLVYDVGAMSTTRCITSRTGACRFGSKKATRARSCATAASRCAPAVGKS